MRSLTFCVLPLAACVLVTGCSTTKVAQRQLPKYEQPLARSSRQEVRTTAYTHSEADHIQHGRKTAAGGTLLYGKVKSAACDWSRWPVGTVFRIKETGELHEVDDYGWALTGTNTIDLYKPSRRSMNKWGVRRVNIEIVRWGDVERSLAILRPRTKHRHCQRMVEQIEDRYAQLSKPMGLPMTAEYTPAAPVAPAPLPALAAGPAPVQPTASTTTIPRATAVTAANRPATTAPAVAPASMPIARAEAVTPARRAVGVNQVPLRPFVTSSQAATR